MAAVVVVAEVVGVSSTTGTGTQQEAYNELSDHVA